MVSGEYDTYDLTSNCIEVQYDDDYYENKLYVKDKGGIAGMPHDAIGYGAVEAPATDYNGTSLCMAHDTLSVITKSEARACLDVVGSGCQYLKAQTCPCFNLYDLHRQQDLDSTSCLGSTIDGGGVKGLVADTTVVAYGLDMDTQQSCIKQGNRIYNINKMQFQHCRTLLTEACPCPESNEFRFRGKTRKWCLWAMKLKTSIRCRRKKILKNCPLTCTGQC